VITIRKPQSIQKIYQTLILGNTLAASFIQAIAVPFLFFAKGTKSKADTTKI